MTTSDQANRKNSLIIQNYPDAFGDTYGVIGNIIFLHKTGPAWFQERYTWRWEREIRPVDHHHPIKPKWRSILRGIVVHFKQPHLNIPINIISGLAFGNQGTGHGELNDTFCELLVVIGIPPVDLVLRLFYYLTSVLSSLYVLISRLSFLYLLSLSST
ncbi:hypothetical protein BJ165DRAFT_1495638 [Panaeolus papilionaceus]|nr:hypothetical protein BJ165DRAFT_1495638 [Panaeolus papilionaceus]